MTRSIRQLFLTKEIIQNDHTDQPMQKEAVTLNARSVDLSFHQSVDDTVPVRIETQTPLKAGMIGGKYQVQDPSDRTPLVEKGRTVSIKSTTPFPPIIAESLPLNPRGDPTDIIGLHSDELSSLLKQFKEELLRRSLSGGGVASTVQAMALTAGTSCDTLL